jgi:DNA polymerase III subunit delta'
LKVLEEPPQRSLFLIVSHHPARLLPTIRSRCRILSLSPLSSGEIVSALTALELDGDPQTYTRAAAMAGGSVRRAIQRLDPHAMKLVDTVRARLDRLPSTDLKDLLGLAESVAGRDKEADLAILLDTIEEWLSEHVRAHAGQGAHRLAPLAQVWDKAQRAAREAEIYNLDRRPLVLSLFQDLSDAVRRSRAA